MAIDVTPPGPPEGAKTVGDVIPHDAVLSRIVIGPGEILVLQLAGQMPDGYMEQLGDLMTRLPRHASLFVFDSGTTVATASEADLRKMLDQLEREREGRPERCPTCNSPSPEFMPATQHEGEVIAMCPDPWHQTGP